MLRLALAGTLAFVSACAPRTAPSTPADWAALADVLGSDEYAEVFLDVLDRRLDDAGHHLTGDQHDALYRVLYDGADAERALLDRYRDAGPEDRAAAVAELEATRARTDAAAAAILTEAQAPTYRALQAEARAYLAQEVGEP